MRRVKYLIPSILALLNVLFIPTFDVWGGLFPSHPEDNFFDIIGTIFTDSDAFQHWGVIIVLSIVIPTIAMLIGAILDNKPVFMISSIAGILLWFKFIISYIRQYELSELFDFDDGSIAIGTWIAIILFVVSFIVAITSSNKQQEQKQPMYQNIPQSVRTPYKPQKVQTDNSLNQVKITYGSFCPKCGAKQEKPSKFCGKCGFKFE